MKTILVWLEVSIITVLMLGIAANLFVFCLYASIYRHLPKGHGRGLRPLHVSMVSFGTLIWQGATVWGTIENFSLEPRGTQLVRFSLLGVAALIILIALVILARFELKRVFIK